MTYMARYGKRGVRSARPAAMGGYLYDEVMNSSEGRAWQQGKELECLASANRNTAALDAKISDLAKNWRPTGFFSPAQVRSIVANTMSVITNARAAVAQSASAFAVDNDGQSNLRGALADMQGSEIRSLEYLAAATAADRSGAKAVDAPGLKSWVTNAMNHASSSFVIADVVMCLRPGWAIFIAGFVALVDVVVNAIKKIVGVVIAAGEAVIDIAADAAESLPMVWTIVKWGGLAALGVLAVWKLQEYRKGRGP